MSKKENPFKEKIKIAMLKKGLNQTKMAKQLGITSQAFSSWLLDCPNPKMETLKKISKVLGVPNNYFFEKSPIINGDNNTVNSKITTEKDIIIMQKEIALMKKDIENINLRMRILEGQKIKK